MYRCMSIIIYLKILSLYDRSLFNNAKLIRDTEQNWILFINKLYLYKNQYQILLKIGIAMSQNAGQKCNRENKRLFFRMKSKLSKELSKCLLIKGKTSVV